MSRPLRRPGLCMSEFCPAALTLAPMTRPTSPTSVHAPEAQRIVHRIPEPCAQVRSLPGAPPVRGREVRPRGPRTGRAGGFWRTFGAASVEGDGGAPPPTPRRSPAQVPGASARRGSSKSCHGGDHRGSCACEATTPHQTPGPHVVHGGLRGVAHDTRGGDRTGRRAARSAPGGHGPRDQPWRGPPPSP
jgi:hypothetical protein